MVVVECGLGKNATIAERNADLGELSNLSYTKAHEGLEGKMLAEDCGMKVQGKNKWLTPNSR